MPKRTSPQALKSGNKVVEYFVIKYVCSNQKKRDSYDYTISKHLSSFKNGFAVKPAQLHVSRIAGFNNQEGRIHQVNQLTIENICVTCHAS